MKKQYCGGETCHNPEHQAIAALPTNTLFVARLDGEEEARTFSKAVGHRMFAVRPEETPLTLRKRPVIEGSALRICQVAEYFPVK